jgi:cyclic pyranopterin phosphate synthase
VAADVARFLRAPALAPASRGARRHVDFRALLAALPADIAASTAPASAPPTDAFGRVHTYLRVSLTERCNLRCVYCMPAAGVPLAPRPELLTADETLALVRLFVAAGVTKVRLTGGEPTVRSDLPALAAAIGALRPALRTLALTTNGLTLERLLPRLIDAGLHAVNVSLDTLRADRFERLTRRRGLEAVRGSIAAALAAGLRDPVKVNVVVIRGVNDDEIVDFVAWTTRAPVHVRFIEVMPFDGNEWSRDAVVASAEIVARVRIAFPSFARVAGADAGATAEDWAVAGAPGRVGFVSSMSDAFCGTCSRLRLTADGALKTCLFGADEVSLRDALRAGVAPADLLRVVRAAVLRKPFALGGHAGPDAIRAAAANRPMILIGG